MYDNAPPSSEKYALAFQPQDAKRYRTTNNHKLGQKYTGLIERMMSDFFDGFESTIDLHGLQVEEGIETLDHFLDQALLYGESEVKIIHGHGGGRLKNAVRAYLKTSPYALSSHPGEPWEGSDGVTIVTLKYDR